MSKNKTLVRSWLVGYRRTCEGTTVVDAATADAAAEKVRRGDFERDTCEEMIDWELRGRVVENN